MLNCSLRNLSKFDDSCGEKCNVLVGMSLDVWYCCFYVWIDEKIGVASVEGRDRFSWKRIPECRYQRSTYTCIYMCMHGIYGCYSAVGSYRETVGGRIPCDHTFVSESMWPRIMSLN